MKQLGNLALVCARRLEVRLQLYNGQVTVHVGQGPERAMLCAAWDDDAQICCIIHELNFGKFSGEKQHNRRLCATSSVGKSLSDMVALAVC